MNKEKFKPLFKTLLILVIFFGYVSIVSSVLRFFNIIDTIIVNFIADLLFFLFIIIVYQNDIRDQVNNLKKNFNLPKIIITIIKWVVILFVANLLMGIITNVIVPNRLMDENTTSIYSLSKISFIYTLFKTLIFASVAEELVFRKSIREVVPNNILFVIISSIIYTFFNIVYGDLGSNFLAIDSLIYFTPSIILSYLYIKNSENILIVMLVKFAYNLIPLTILLMGI